MPRTTGWAGAFLVGLAAGVCQAAGGPRIEAAYGALPLTFEQNAGQTAPQVDFLSRGPGSAIFLTRGGAIVRLPGGEVRIDLAGANRRARARGLEPLGAWSHYITGSRVITAPSFGRVEYQQVYQGIDLVYYARHRELEFDFVVAPGADPRQIRLAFEGAQEARLDGRGRLGLRTAGGDLWLSRPRVYQQREGARREIPGAFVLLSRNQAGFQVGAYDPGLPLVIDPVLSYATYLGGAAFDSVQGIAVDSSGCAYVAGWTESVDFPVANPAQGSRAGSTDAFVAKLSPGGTSLIYSTYLGGTADDRAFAIAVDRDGAAVVTGWTYSSNFPRVAPAQVALAGGRDAFVAKLSPSGSSLIFSTFLGGSGSDSGNGVAVDSQGDLYVAGETDSTNFPVRDGLTSANQGGSDAFAAKFSSTGALVYATYLGGNGRDRATAIAVDSLGQAYVTGATESSNFPTVSAFQPGSGGLQDAFVAKLNSSGNALIYSTYLGGSGGSVLFAESGQGIAVDAGGNAYVSGVAASNDFPVQNPLRVCVAGSATDAFVAKLNPWGSGLVYSTCLGGGGPDYGVSIAVDSGGSAHVAGHTGSTAFPTSNPLQATHAGNYDAFVTTLAPAGNTLTFSTYLGGQGSDSALAVALDPAGNIYVAGQTLSSDFPVVRAIQAQNGGLYGGFVAKIRTQPCAFQLNPSGPLRVSSAGVSGGIAVSAEPDCQWTAASDSAWISLAGAGVRYGSATVDYQVDPYTGATPRSGTLYVAAKSVAVIQSAGIIGFTGAQFAYLNSSHGLVNDQVSSIVSDSTGALYFTTGYSYLASFSVPGGGVSRWDHRQFTSLTTAHGLASNTVQASLYDPSTNLLWFGTDNGISRYNPASGAFLPTLLPGVKITSLKRDGGGSIWVGTFGNGVYRFSSAGAQMAQYTYASTGGGLVDDRVTGLAIDSLNALWVGTDRGAPDGSNFNRGGISRLAIGSGTWTPINLNAGGPPPPAPLSIDANRINALEVDASDNVWMAIRNNGAVRRTQAGVISSFRYDSNPPFGGHVDNFAFTIYRDSGNNLWFGFGGYGDIANPRKVAATLLPASEVNAAAPAFVNYNKEADGFPSNLIISFSSEASGAMWFGFMGGGVARLGGPRIPAGWPQPLTGFVFFSSPALADLDGNRNLEVIVGDSAGFVYAFRPDGSLLWRFDARNAFAPGTAGAVSVQSSPAVGDVDGDGEPEVVVGVSGQVLSGLIGVGQGGVLILSRWGALKRVLPTYDFTNSANRGAPEDGFTEGVFATPVLMNVDDDPEPEILVGAFDNFFYAWNGDGTPIYAVDNDGDGRFNEDFLGDFTPYTPFNSTNDAPGVKGVDDDGNGEIDEGNPSDDDEDGMIDEDYPEFPVNVSDTTLGAAVVGDLLGTGRPAIIVGSDFAGGPGQPFGRGGVLRALDPEGKFLPGFPKGNLEQVIWSSPVLVDLDGDGYYEILHGSGLDLSTVGDTPTEQLIGQLVWAWRRDATSFIPGANGRFATTQGRSQASFAVGDLDNDGQPELVIATSSLRNKWGQLIDAAGNPTSPSNAIGQLVYAFRRDGTLLPGFPVRPYPIVPGANLVGSPVLADADGDGYLDIFVPVAGGLIGFDRNGRVLSGMGVFENLQDMTYSGEMTSTPAVGDIDLDGYLELVWAIGTGANTGGMVRVVRLGPVNPTVQRSWPLFLRAPNRNGVFDVAIGRAQAYENAGQLQISVQAFAGRSPISSVTIDLSALGGSSAFVLVDNGTNGDPVANDGFFSGNFSVGSVAPGRYQLPVTVADSAGRTSRQTIYYARRGTSRQISVSVSSINFGSVYQGLGKEGYFSIMNVSSSSNVTVSSIISSNSQFAVRTPVAFPQTLAPGQVLMVRLLLKPDFNPVGARSATLTISSDDAAAPARAIALSGTAAAGSGGITPLVTVLGFSAAVGSYQDLYLNIDSTGSTPVVIRDVQFGDPAYQLWKPSNPRFPRTFDPGVRLPMLVRFRPDRAGTINTTMQILTNDPAKPVVSITLNGTATGSSCLFYLDSTTAGFPDAGGPGRVRVTVNQTGCSWTALSNAPWITLTSTPPPTGSGDLYYTVAPNATGATRAGTLTIGGHTFTVTQVIGCSFTLSTYSLSVPWQGAKGTVQLTASSPGCPWTSYSTTNWAQRYPHSGTGSAAIEYTIYPSFNTGGRTATFYIANLALSVTQAPSPMLEEDRRFVTLLYFGFQGRVPSQAEIDFQYNALLGGLSRADLAMNFFNSDEFNNGGRFISGLYVGILGRDAEFAGWLFQRSAYLNGIVTQMQLVSNFLNSLEYQLKYGTPPDAEFVRILYRNVLRREPSQAEVDFQVAALQSGTSRTQLAWNFLTSAEFRQNSGPRLTAFLQYACLLLRDAEQWERDYWANLMIGGMSVRDVFGYFVHSAEMGLLLR